MLSPNINITPAAIVRASAASSQSIKLEPEPVKNPVAIVSYDGVFSNKSHIKFHIAIENNEQAYDVYALGTDKIGNWEAQLQQTPGKTGQIDQHERVTRTRWH